MGRSSPGRRRPAGQRVPAAGAEAASTGVGLAPTPSLTGATTPRVWQGTGYRPLPDPSITRALFEFTAVPWPDPGRVALAWGAFAGGGGAPEHLVGAVVGESEDRATLLHGPVVVEHDDPLEVAAQLVAAALDHATALGAHTIFARPLGLDRVWVRFGFIPVPESTLPAALAGRSGAGLYAWRGGSALWTLREAPRET
ncbi:MAG: hypothetical protein ACREM3_12225 [Candidatus Rokuibacteriota bacterium]